MTKRSRTTGMPKDAGKANPSEVEGKKPQPRLLGEYKSRHEREAAIQRYVVIGAVVIGALALLLVAVALISEQVIRPNQPVATVNGENITVSQFEQRVRLERVLINQQLTQGYNTLLSFGLDPQQAQQQLSQFPPYSTYLEEISVPDQLGNRVLNDMVEDALVRQQAAQRGITASQEQIDERVQEFFGFNRNDFLFTPTPSPTPTSSPTPFITSTPSPVPSATPAPTLTPTSDAALIPTLDPALTTIPTLAVTPTFTAVPSSTPTATVEPTLELGTREAQFNTNRQDFLTYLSTVGRVNESDLRSYFEMRVLRDAVRDSIAAELPRTTPFVNVRHILVDTQELAQEVLESLQAGESFATLAAAVSTDDSNSGNGGDLGWAPASRYVEEFEQAALTAEIGAFVGPVETEFGWHILQVRGREDREMTDTEYEQAQQREFQDWLENLRTEQSANIQTFDTWVDNVPTEPRVQLLSAP
jgi:hypothetical protein